MALKINFQKPDLSTIVVIIITVVVLGLFLFKVANSPKTDSGESFFESKTSAKTK